MTTLHSSAKTIGELLAKQIEQDPHFYLFSPDETTSNKLDAVYDVSTRAWNSAKEKWDLPEKANGRIVELLSENTLFGVMSGHVLSGEQAMMASYESFFSVITSQILQHIKFLEQSGPVKWRPDYPAINLLSTSTCWRQDHNGFTHQSPALISTLLSLPSNKTNCLFPIDDNASKVAFKFMLKSKNVVNLTTFNKTEEPRWLTVEQATEQLKNSGASIIEAVSDRAPEFVFAGAGDIASREAIYAMQILKNDIPSLKMRFVNIAALSYNAIGTTENQLTKAEFNKLFTNNKLILANFHGYADTLQHILAQYTDPKRIKVHGFSDQGTTTTPFEMLSLNQASRYHLAIDVAKQLHRYDLTRKYQKIIDDNHEHAKEFGIDSDIVLQ